MTGPCGEPGCDCGHTIEKLQRFKDWVHSYLDSKGVPHHPPGTHGAEGCRIGDRMDWLMDTVDKLKAENARLKELVKELWNEVEYDCDHRTRVNLVEKVATALAEKEPTTTVNLSELVERGQDVWDQTIDEKEPK